MHPSQSIIAHEIMKGNPDKGITPNIAMTAKTRLAIAKLSAVLFEIKDFSELVMSASLVRLITSIQNLSVGINH